MATTSEKHQLWPKNDLNGAGSSMVSQSIQPTFIEADPVPPQSTVSDPSGSVRSATTTTTVDYYNELDLINLPKSNSATVAASKVTNVVTSNSNNQPQTSRDSPLFFTNCSSRLSAIQPPVLSFDHRRYPSSASTTATSDNPNESSISTSSNNQNMLLLLNTSNGSGAGSSSIQPHTHNTNGFSNMVAIDFPVLSRNFSLNSSSTTSSTYKSMNSMNGTINGHGGGGGAPIQRSISSGISTTMTSSGQYSLAAPPPSISSYHTVNSSGSGRSHEEDIYEDLCYVTLRSSREREKALGTLQLEPIEKRDYCIKELVETEKNYCEALRMIISHFYQPLSKVLHLEDRRLIFNNLKSLTDVHSKFYNSLYRACSQPSPSTSNNSTPPPPPTTVPPSLASSNSSSTESIQPPPQSINGTNLINSPAISMPSLSLISNHHHQPSSALPPSSSSSSSSNQPTQSTINHRHSNSILLSTSPSTTSIYQQPTPNGGCGGGGNVNGSFSCLSTNSSVQPPSHPPPTLSHLYLNPSLTASVSSLTNSSGQFNQIPLNPSRLSSCFLTYRERFLIYAEYCANLPKAQALLDELCSRDEVISQCVGRCQDKANDGKFKLRDLLSLPMQRILKYHLLLGELIKSTTETHEDFAGLKVAHDAMLDIGGYINEVKRDTETLEIIRDVQRSIVDLSMPENYELKDYGRLIKDGELRIRSHDDPRLRLKNRYVFVFDKVLLMCKALRGLQYSYKEAIVLEEFKIEEIGTSSPISKLTKQWSNGWSLVNSRTKQTYSFHVKNEDLKRKWLEAIERAQDTVRPKDLFRTDHRFSMSTVPIATYCVACSKLLRGIWYQGYQCQICTAAVHKACIALVKPCGSCAMTGTISVNHHHPNHHHNHNGRKDQGSSSLNSSFDSNCSNNTNNTTTHTTYPNSEAIRKGAHLLSTLLSATTACGTGQSQQRPTLSTTTTLSRTNQMMNRSICAPPTPSRTKRVIAKAISVNNQALSSSSSSSTVNGPQLAFDIDDTIVVYAKHGPNSWYGRNVRTDEEGSFNPALVCELAGADSPSASSSLDSPTAANTSSSLGFGNAPRFSYEDPFGSMNEVAFHSLNSTLSRKLCASAASGSAGGTPSPLQTGVMPSSPLASVTLSSPLSIPEPLQTSTPNSTYNGNYFFNSNTLVAGQNTGAGNSSPGFTASNAAENEANLRLVFGNGFNLEEYSWFAGSMDRDTAQTTLGPLPNGSFLVRISPKQKNSYAISINYNGQVKHMRVCSTDVAGVTATTVHSNLAHNDLQSTWPYKSHYYLSETRYFRTIVDLVRWYEMNSLAESFNMVNTQLLLPYKKAYSTEVLGYAVALYAFTGTSSAASSFLSLRKGDRVTVLSRAAEDKGWWKGQLQDRIGYFPFKYVQPTTPSLKVFTNNNNTNGNPGFVVASNVNHHSHAQQHNHQPLPVSQPDILTGLIASRTSSEPLNSPTTPTSLLNGSGSCSSAKVLKSFSSVSSSSSSSTSSSSSPTTLSSPVNSDSSSLHSRQASGDAGIEILPNFITTTAASTSTSTPTSTTTSSTTNAQS